MVGGKSKAHFDSLGTTLRTPCSSWEVRIK
jgi:hypothetical protein